MLAIQVAIGALNDRVDAQRDAIAKPGKPIPAGLASAGEALGFAVVAGVLGLTLSAMSGLPTAGVIGFGLAAGVIYDLRLSRTRWSWLPLALALPVVPLHAWLGATGAVPLGLLPLVPTAVVAGAALALGNGLVDLERDAETGRPAAAVALGTQRAWLLHVLLLVVVSVLAVFVAPASPPSPGVPSGTGGLGSGGVLPLAALQWLRTWAVAVGIAALGCGAVAVRAQRPGIRERGWELEALGIACAGVGWLAGTAASVGGGGT
jgi:4-hydroxybenzoate polyprenyltransferase